MLTKIPSQSVTAHGANQIVHFGVGLIVGAILVLLWAATLAVVMTLRRQKPYEGDWRPLYWFEAFFRTGSIIFGGGQVSHLTTSVEIYVDRSTCTNPISWLSSLQVR